MPGYGLLLIAREGFRAPIPAKGWGKETSVTQASTASAGTQDGEKKNSGNEGDRTFTQEEVNSMLAKERRETQAKYPHYDEYKQAYDEAQKKAEADKSELQKATDRADAAEAELAKLKSEKERASWIAAISKETGVPEAALHGDTEEDVRACAESLKSYFEDPAAPTVKTGKPSNTDAPESNDPLRALFEG